MIFLLYLGISFFFTRCKDVLITLKPATNINHFNFLLHHPVFNGFLSISIPNPVIEKKYNSQQYHSSHDTSPLLEVGCKPINLPGLCLQIVLQRQFRFPHLRSSTITWPSSTNTSLAFYFAHPHFLKHLVSCLSVKRVLGIKL